MLKKENTEISVSLSASLSSQYRSTADTVRADIQDAMRFHTFVNTPNMIDTFFPKDSPLLAPVVEHVLERVTKRGIWRSGDKSWRALPKKPKHESELYTPLTTIMRDITRIAVDFCKAKDHGSPCSVTWSDEHNKKISSRYAIEIRPDIVASFMKATWWRLLQAILEVKKSKYISAASVVQLLQYIRTALKEQIDRHFMFGMMFGKRDLSVGLVDRSGVMASEPFDIHEVRFPDFLISCNAHCFQTRTRSSSSVSSSVLCCFPIATWDGTPLFRSMTRRQYLDLVSMAPADTLTKSEKTVIRPQHIPPTGAGGLSPSTNRIQTTCPTQIKSNLYSITLSVSLVRRFFVVVRRGSG